MVRLSVMFCETFDRAALQPARSRIIPSAHSSLSLMVVLSFMFWETSISCRWCSTCFISTVRFFEGTILSCLSEHPPLLFAQKERFQIRTEHQTIGLVLQFGNSFSGRSYQLANLNQKQPSFASLNQKQPPFSALLLDHCDFCW